MQAFQNCRLKSQKSRLVWWSNKLHDSPSYCLPDCFAHLSFKSIGKGQLQARVFLAILINTTCETLPTPSVVSVSYLRIRGISIPCCMSPTQPVYSFTFHALRILIGWFTHRPRRDKIKWFTITPRRIFFGHDVVRCIGWSNHRTCSVFLILFSHHLDTQIVKKSCIMSFLMDPSVGRLGLTSPCTGTLIPIQDGCTPVH